MTSSFYGFTEPRRPARVQERQIDLWPSSTGFSGHVTSWPWPRDLFRAPSTLGETEVNLFCKVGVKKGRDVTRWPLGTSDVISSHVTSRGDLWAPMTSSAVTWRHEVTFGHQGRHQQSRDVTRWPLGTSRTSSASHVTSRGDLWAPVTSSRVTWPHHGYGYAGGEVSRPKTLTYGNKNRENTGYAGGEVSRPKTLTYGNKNRENTGYASGEVSRKKPWPMVIKTAKIRGTRAAEFRVKTWRMEQGTQALGVGGWGGWGRVRGPEKSQFQVPEPPKGGWTSPKFRILVLKLQTAREQAESSGIPVHETLQVQLKPNYGYAGDRGGGGEDGYAGLKSRSFRFLNRQTAGEQAQSSGFQFWNSNRRVNEPKFQEFQFMKPCRFSESQITGARALGIGGGGGGGVRTGTRAWKIAVSGSWTAKRRVNKPKVQDFSSETPIGAWTSRKFRNSSSWNLAGSVKAKLRVRGR